MTVSGVETGVAVEKVLLEGEEFFIAYAPLPSLGGSFAVAAPVSEITADAAAITAGVDEEGTRTFRVMLAAMGALFLLGVVGAGYLNRRVLLHPIGELLRGARSVGAGDLDTAIPVRSRDELGALAGAFNSMVDEVRAHGAALEQEVHERQEAQGELNALFAAMDDVVIVFDGDGRCVRMAPTNPDPLSALPGIWSGVRCRRSCRPRRLTCSSIASAPRSPRAPCRPSNTRWTSRAAGAGIRRRSPRWAPIAWATSRATSPSACAQGNCWRNASRSARASYDSCSTSRRTSRGTQLLGAPVVTERGQHAVPLLLEALRPFSGNRVFADRVRAHGRPGRALTRRHRRPPPRDHRQPVLRPGMRTSASASDSGRRGPALGASPSDRTRVNGR